MDEQGEVLELCQISTEELIKKLRKLAFRFVILSNPREFYPDFQIRVEPLIRAIRVVNQKGLPEKEGRLFGYTHLRITNPGETIDIEGRQVVQAQRQTIEWWIQSQPKENRDELLRAIFS